jgi:3-oxocholest-4-en-26-oyl-CoA dehydrogenase beta subunit
MDFGLTETQIMLKTTAKDFLAVECPKKLVRTMEQDDIGFPAEFWDKMVKLGWIGLPIPEHYGGSGGSFLDLAVLLQEMGRALVPGPFFSTVILGALIILDAGNKVTKEQILPQIVEGKIKLTLALNEPNALYSANGITMKATEEDGYYYLSGIKLFVPDAIIADKIICCARTGKDSHGEDGISLFLVDTENPGLQISRLKTIGGDKLFEVKFDTHISRNNVLGVVNQGWYYIQRALHRASIGKCAEMVGGSEHILDMTTNYAKERKQFGHPIGSYQLIQDHCVQMAIFLRTSQFITYKTAWKISQGLPHFKEASMAKAWVNEAYVRMTALAQQCQGGNAYMLDHDMPLYYNRAKAAELVYGDSDFHYDIVANELGL